MKRIPYGISDYGLLIKDNYYYIDKTMYLEELENIGRTLVFLRPRRFGKTLFTSMMGYYYDINSKDKFEELFKDTYVYDNPTCNKNNYYVLKFDFSSISNYNELNDIMKSFNSSIVRGITNFLNRYDLSYNIDTSFFPADILGNFLEYFNGLKLNNKIYLMIDEYDNFTNGILKSNELFKNILSENGYVRTFYSIIKEYSGTVIDRTFITGVCSISLDSMSSGFNISTNISNDLKLNSMLGLTHNDVKDLIKELPNKNKIYDLLVSNYDGYLFNGEAKERVFNSTLVMRFLSNYYEENTVPDNLFDSNIVSSYGKLKSIVMLNNNNCYLNIIDSLFYNRNITGTLKNSFNVNTITTPDDIVSLLYYFGYITIDRKLNGLSCLFKIPNKMMDLVYNDYYMSLVINKPLDNNELDNSITEIKNNGNISLICNMISDIIKNADNRIYNNFNERSIQLMFYSLLAKYNEFDTRFEYPVKDKFIDLMIFKNKDKSNYDIMIEFKYIKKREYKRSLLERLKNTGIEQLKEYVGLLDVSKLNLKKYLVIYVGSEIKVMEEII